MIFKGVMRIKRKIAMTLTRLSKVLEDADTQGYAVGAFNVFNLESLQAVIRAAELENSPIIIMFYYTVADRVGPHETACLAKGISKETDVPVVLHLDHSKKLDLALRCAFEGYTSVMYDGSEKTLKVNISKTNRLTEIVNLFGVDVEAELGYIGSAGENDNSNSLTMTKPQNVEKFLESTDIDALAVAIGNAHGVYKDEPNLDFERLKEINSVSDVPLVLHGGTGIKDDDLRKAVDNGVRKVNIGTKLSRIINNDFVISFNDEEFDVRRSFEKAKKSVTRYIRKKIRVLGSDDRY